jgi:hypothetical protein
MQPKKLEHYKYFQPVAWTLCIGFAAYVGFLALNIDDQISSLESSSLSFEERLNRLEQTVGASTTTTNQR